MLLCVEGKKSPIFPRVISESKNVWMFKLALLRDSAEQNSCYLMKGIKTITETLLLGKSWVIQQWILF
jgi:hypothetical protein